MTTSGHPLLSLTSDQLLTTTRAVRKRLDFTRPVPRSAIDECLEIAVQAPSASNRQQWQFVVVTDSAKRKAVADLYRQSVEAYRARRPTWTDPARRVVQERVSSSADYLAEHMHEAPVHVFPCIYGRTENQPVMAQASQFGTIAPATWSFMLAARARGLGTVWTTLHLAYERETADILGIPYDEVMQTALIPVAYTIGTDFKPGPRLPLETVAHWDGW
ncbi:MAG: nitroreductase family protein [Chloroflexi bacterium]|nr:nitroreductase family protein [Chloroflexota bacterium]